MTEFRERVFSHRPELLRHCYRMLGSFADAEDLVQEVLLNAWKGEASFSGQVPLRHWLMRIATNACLNELSRRRRRGLPQLDVAESEASEQVERCEPAQWLTPAPDSRLFAEPARAVEARESVALAFLALLQRLPPRQRAVLLLKDVVGWSAAEVAEGLGISMASVSSALHRARQTLSVPEEPRSTEPTPETWGAYVRAWEQHDVRGLVALMRDDIVFSMPPHATWFRGRTNVERFLRSPLFTERWSAGFRTLPSRANGEHALAFFRREGEVHEASSLQVVRFIDDQIAEMVSFVGADYLTGFDLPKQL